MGFFKALFIYENTLPWNFTDIDINSLEEMKNLSKSI